MNPVPGAAEQNALISRQNFLEHDRGPPVWQMGHPLFLKAFQLLLDAPR
ncbi:hypothetical protein PAMC26510_29760 [Caballeronia sordidicola]|uniref:Uncharacterized protein n=1 Tax=Caballeronia sordidicola TaxID=196367 RepID=A0A242M9M9_CABSO|nr:hypothetical protein PAMC26510_29760 [Caballeronia sordidicola]